MNSGSDDRHLDALALRFARTDYVRILVNQTVGEALAHVRQNNPGGRIIYFYVVDESDRLRGILPTRRLLLSPLETPIEQIMVREVIALPATATLLDACEFFILHRLLAFPIVDADRHLLGVVDVDVYTEEISEIARREESEDVFQLIGVRLAQVQQASLLGAYTRRFPWLLCNIGGGLACAALAGWFEHVLQQVIVLSLFIPVVLAVAESVSIQTLSLALQAHHGNRFRWRETLQQFRREIPQGALLGISCGALVGATLIVWQQLAWAGLVVLVSMTLAVTHAAIMGLLIPTALHALQRDPKVASGPIVLAITDLGTLFFYLGLAAILLV